MRWGSPALLLLCCTVAACGGSAPPWRETPAAALLLSSSPPPERIELLQPFELVLDLYRRADVAVEFAPQWEPADFHGELRELPEQPYGAGYWQRWQLQLRPLRGPGELELPSFVARASDGSIAASTPARTLLVQSLLDDAAADLEAPADPLPGPRAYYWWLLGAWGGFALLLLLYYGWRRPRRGAAQPGTVALPCHTKAQRALQRLRGQPRTTPAQIEAFYVELSQLLRVYIEERFGLRAPERTTEEFLRELEGGDSLASQHRAELQRFLLHCDLVKFAAHLPADGEQLAMLELAEGFVEATRPDRGDTTGGTA